MAPHNPILEQSDFFKLKLFASRPSLEPGIALVLSRESGEIVTLLKGQRITIADVALGKYKWYYKIDIALHTFNFKADIPCRKGAFDFKADVQLNYQVHEPEEIVKHQIKDIHEFIQPEIISRMRKISRNFESHESEAAEMEINSQFEKNLMINGILINRIIVNLDLEDSSRQYVRTKEDFERQKDLQKAEGELVIVRDDLDVERKRKKMEFYSPLIREGQWQLLALHLTEHPEDVTTITQMLSRQHQDEMQNQLVLLKVMLEEDAIEGFQLEDVRKRVLHKLVDNLGNKFLEDKRVQNDYGEKKDFQQEYKIEDSIEIVDGDINIIDNTENSIVNSIEIEENTQDDDL